jgi:rhodanese-related sulfurtransferase
MAEKREFEPFTRIDVHEAKELIDEGGVQVIDSREPHEHAEGHVPGSIQIQHMATLAQADKIARDRPVLFICKSGQRSAVAAEFAASLGITDIYNVEGGHDAWREAGYPLDEE